MRSPSSAEYRKQYGNAVFVRPNSMLASRRRENQSRGRHRGRRQHPSSRVLRDLLGPGDPAPRARHRLLGVLRGGTPASRGRGRPAVQPAHRTRRASDPAPPGTVINLPFITPPTSALLALPLTALDPGTAFRLWSLIELILLALAVWIAIRAGPWPSSARSPRAATALMALAAGGTYAFLISVRSTGSRRSAWRPRTWPGERTVRPPQASGWRSRCRHQAAPCDRARRLAHRPPGLAGARRRTRRERRGRRRVS